MDLASIPFRATSHTGISIHVYYRDHATGHTAVMIKMEPGASYPQHRHRGAEELLVLQGGFRDGQGTYRAGEFARFEDGSVHHPIALEDGPPCIIFAIAQEGIDLLGPGQ